MDDWVCNVCGEEFEDDGKGRCPRCGSQNIEEQTIDDWRLTEDWDEDA